MTIRFLLILIWTNAIEASHFNGGTITWTPVYPNSTSSSILITVTQSYSWVYPTVSCLTNVPISSGGGYASGNVNLTCVANCSTQSDYPSKIINILTDCTSSSSSLGMLTSQRSVNISLNVSTYFWIAYRGASWRSLQNAATNITPSWSIVSLIDLRRRSDGLINTPPVSQVTSPQYVIVNRTTAIKIPVSDVNADDDLRCRWSSKNSSYGVDECGDVCTSSNVTSLANLSDCTLTFTATKSGVWYAMALQVEDFMNTTSTDPMSSVVVQFLIYVLPSPNCSQAPLILPLTGCLEVQVNVSVTFTLYTMNYCNRTKVIITDFIPTTGITGMSVSSLVNSTTNTSLVYVTLSWTPQVNQIGLQEFCAVAYTSEKVQSDPYCVTFTVTTSQPCTTTSTSTTSTTTSTTSDTTTATTSTETTSTSTTSTTISTTSETTTTTTTGTTSTTSETTTTTSVTTTTTSETTTTTTSITTSTTSQTTTTTTSTETTTTTTTTQTTTTTTTTTSTTSKTTTTTTSTQTTTTTSTTTTSTTSTTSTTTSTTSETTTTTTSTQTTTTTSTQTTTTTTTTATSTTSKTTTSTTSTTTSSTTSTTTTVTSTTSETTTTTTSTQTTTTTATTATTATTTTQTTTTVTTATTTSTTSATTTTQTTTITSSSNQINIPLIVGLSILGLILALGCASFWLYYLKRSPAARSRQLNKRRKDLQLETDTASVEEDITEIQPSRKSQKYITCNELNTEETSNSFPSKSSIETRTTSGNDNERINSAVIVKVKKSAKSSKEENISVQSHQHQDSDRNTTAVEKQSRSQYSSVTASTMKKSSSVSELVKDNVSNKLSTLHHAENEISPLSSTKIHVVKLPKNKVSAASFKTPTNTLPESNDGRIRSQNKTDTVNNNHSVNDILNQKSNDDNSSNIMNSEENQIPSTHTSRNIVVKIHNVRHNQVGHKNSSNTNEHDDMRHRASSFGGITVSKIKTDKNKGRSFADHPMGDIGSSNDKKGPSNGVTVVSIKNNSLKSRQRSSNIQ